MFAATPFMFIVGGLMGHFTTKYTLASQDAYAQAGTVAENAFNSIRTIYSFNLERRFLDRYKKELDNAFSSGLKRATVSGLGMAASMSSMLCIYALTLWYGSTLVIKDQLTGPTVFIVLLSMILGSVGLFTFPINLAAISAAQGSAYRMFAIIDRVPEIDVDAKEGVILDSITGDIEFKGVMFSYPTRPGVAILDNLSLTVHAGMTVAFVVSLPWDACKSKHMLTPRPLSRDPQAQANQPLSNCCSDFTTHCLALFVSMAMISRHSMSRACVKISVLFNRSLRYSI